MGIGKGMSPLPAARLQFNAQEEFELSRDSYAKLYEFAPVGYFVFDGDGVIREVNLTGTQLLGTERRILTNKPFSDFIDEESEKDVFATHLALVLQRQVMLRCEINFTGNNGTRIYGQLHSVAVTIADNAGYILTSVVDVTVSKQLEDKRKNAHDTLQAIVLEKTGDLTRVNIQLRRETVERKRIEESCQDAYAEIKRLKDRLQAENFNLQEGTSQEFSFGELIGQSNPMLRVCSQIEQVAPMNATVLLLGETGTGKGVVSRAIHSCSARKGRPLIIVDCTTLPAALVESELFGRERGAYTGSDSKQIGRFELADGGTIFLDEIGAMPLEIQCKLLRVIQDGEFERLGSPRTIKIDVRIIAATNRNLEEDVKNGMFREDLFYRLNVFPITMPPLRQRKEDIPLLVSHFVTKFNKKIGKKIDTLSKDTLNALQEYHWPGNVRELESVIERAVIISEGNVLQVMDRGDTLLKPLEPTAGEIKALALLEREHIIQTLQKTGWRIEGKNGAAVLLDLNASTLRARMRKYGISRSIKQEISLTALKKNL